MNGKVECGKGVTRNAQLANRKLITIVLYESGGVISKVHTEDIAIKAHEMFPDSFSWTKYPDRVDKDIVRVALVEAARQLNGAMVDGRSGRGRGHTKGKSQPRETDGWKLTETGIAFAKENIEAIVSAHRRSDPKSHRQEQQRVLGRVLPNTTTSSWTLEAVTRPASVRLWLCPACCLFPLFPVALISGPSTKSPRSSKKYAL